MAKLSPPPQNIDLMIAGRLTPQWKAYFQQLEIIADLIAEYEEPAILTQTFTADTTLSAADFGNHLVFNIGATDVTCNLMAVTANDLFKWITIFRVGTGRLTLIPTSTMRIESSAYGGKFWCNDFRRMAANVTLQPISGTQWAITGATGEWKFE